VQQLEPLVAPVALYPDPLLAVVLPASTYPDAVQDASKWVAANPSPPDAAIDAQVWPGEVKALVHYPDALVYLSGDAQFTASLGAAYTSQPANVTLAVQDLRLQANTAGSLQTNSQQVVVQQAGIIAIQPATPEVIYVPRYDPVTIYAVGYTPIVYGPSFVVGPWLVNGYDWSGGGVFIGDWRGPYYYEGGRWGYHEHWDHPDHWRHDERFGRAPYSDGHYHYARGIDGRENVLRQRVAQHAAAVHRENAERANTGSNRAGQALVRNPGPSVAHNQQRRPNGVNPAGRVNGQARVGDPKKLDGSVADPRKIDRVEKK